MSAPARPAARPRRYPVRLCGYPSCVCAYLAVPRTSTALFKLSCSDRRGLNASVSAAAPPGGPRHVSAATLGTRHTASSLPYHTRARPCVAGACGTPTPPRPPARAPAAHCSLVRASRPSSILSQASARVCACVRACVCMCMCVYVWLLVWVKYGGFAAWLVYVCACTGRRAPTRRQPIPRSRLSFPACSPPLPVPLSCPCA
jgi:hypothetical protein